MSLYCITKKGETFKVFSDNTEEETYDVYPVDEKFSAQSTVLETLKYSEVFNTDTNLSLLSNMQINQYSYELVLHFKNAKSRLNGGLMSLHSMALELGYPFLLWEDKIFKVDDNGVSDTGRTIDHII